MRMTFKALETVVTAKYENAKEMARLASTPDAKNRFNIEAGTYADILCLLTLGKDYFTSIYNIWTD